MRTLHRPAPTYQTVIVLNNDRQGIIKIHSHTKDGHVADIERVHDNLIIKEIDILHQSTMILNYYPYPVRFTYVDNVIHINSKGEVLW